MHDCNDLLLHQVVGGEKACKAIWRHNHQHTLHKHAHTHTHTYAQTEDIKVETTTVYDEKCDVTVHFRFPLEPDCR